MPGTISPRHIVEAVLDAYLTAESGLAGVAVYTGDNAEINVLPKCVVLCDSARTPPELPEGAGNYLCSVRVTLFSNADDTTLAAHRARCAALAGAMSGVTAVKAPSWLTGPRYATTSSLSRKTKAVTSAPGLRSSATPSPLS